MKLKKWQITVTLVCLISGILISLQLEVQSNKAFSDSTEKNHDLVAMIKELEDETFSMEDRADNLRKAISTYQQDLIQGQTALEQMQSQLNMLKSDLDLTEVTAPGIIIYIDDNVADAENAKADGMDNYRPDDYIIHYKNLLYLINELRHRATAITINDQRIAASTDIRCVGTVILVNTTRLAPPYEVKLAGNQTQLVYALNNSDELAYLKGRGFPVEVELKDEVTLNSYRGGYRYNHAELVEEDEA